MSAGPWQAPGSGPDADTGERLRAALSARSAQVGADGSLPVGPYAAGPVQSGPPAHDPSGYTWAENAGGHRPPAPAQTRAPLFPRWAKLTLALGLVLSAAVGIVLGLHSSSGSSTPALPPARETSYGNDRARVAITSFYRQGRFVTLELELTNLAPLGSDNSWSVNSAFSNSGYDLSGIRLLDPVSGASYRPAEDGKRECLCTNTVSLTIAAGSSSRVSAQFPAPDASVKSMTIDIPGVGSFRDVQLD